MPAADTPPELVDTHCHIQSADTGLGRGRGERATQELWAKAPDLSADAIIEKAAAAGVTKLICVGCDLEDSRLAVDFVQARTSCWASIGIHPHEAKHFETEDSRQSFERLIRRPKVVAVGECGLDYYYGHSPKAAQEAALCYQLELAIQHKLPLIFHVREAFDDFWPIIDRYDSLRGVLHSFTDSADNLSKALERGLYIGVNGIATFAKDEKLLDVYRQVPLQKLLLETDAPFLTHTPYRGSINEPMQVGTISEFLAGLRGINRGELARATSENARQLFGI